MDAGTRSKLLAVREVASPKSIPTTRNDLTESVY